jgi:hypothetical protein
VAKKLTMKELGELQETANQALGAGKSKSEVVSQMVSDGIDDLTAQRIADSAELRVRRDNDEDLPPPKRVFTYSVIMGAVFMALGIGVVAYSIMRPQEDMTVLVVGGIAVVWGLIRVVMGVMSKR